MKPQKRNRQDFDTIVPMPLSRRTISFRAIQTTHFPMKFPRLPLEQFALLRRARPSPTVLRVYVATFIRKAAGRLRGTAERDALLHELDSEGTYTTRWFDGHVSEWMRIFRLLQLPERPVRVLEIGAWEGRSTAFLLRQLPLSGVTAVDTWEGSIEHAGDPRLARIEQLFDANMARYGNRLTKFKSTSAEFFRHYGQSPGFDLIHVDGSHAADDVMHDAKRSFALLKPGGVMILDDYLWDRGADPCAAPAVAINRFLRENRGRFRLLSVTTQVVLRKAP
jgi:predicted O-methyltransferase YrrM